MVHEITTNKTKELEERKKEKKEKVSLNITGHKGHFKFM